jgi:hypothetical protein
MLKLGNKWRKRPRNPKNRSVGGPQRRVGFFGKQKKI